jgi:hypothetical protein
MVSSLWLGFIMRFAYASRLWSIFHRPWAIKIEVLSVKIVKYKDNIALPQTTREFSAKERRLLKLILENRKRDLSPGNKIRFLLVSLIIGILFAAIASQLEDGILLFLAGTIAVFSFVIFVFSIKPFIQETKEEKHLVRKLETYIEKGTVQVVPINALNIAQAMGFKDETILYIIEFEKDKIFFYWDYKYSLLPKFPCLKFEIYDDEYYDLTNRQFNFLSKKIETIMMDGKFKGNHTKSPIPGQFEIRITDFHNLINEWSEES